MGEVPPMSDARPGFQTIETGDGGEGDGGGGGGDGDGGGGGGFGEGGGGLKNNAERW